MVFLQRFGSVPEPRPCRLDHARVRGLNALFLLVILVIEPKINGWPQSRANMAPVWRTREE
jgi:hypothetical protein